MVCVETFSYSIYIIFFIDELVLVIIILLVFLGLGVEEFFFGKFNVYSFGFYLNFWDERLEFLLKFFKIY